jgi:hypothetical protein
MKNHYAIILTALLTLVSYQSNAQQPRADIIIEGVKDTCCVKRAAELEVRVEGVGYNEFRLSGSGCKLLRGEGYYVVIPGEGKKIVLTVAGKDEDGRSIMVRRQEYMITD